ncbi:SDR family NAD(P)-dependent oxidoreductase [Streptomyces sp. NPDC054834]
MIAWVTCPYQGWIAFVTEAGTGIGRATAHAFLERGACVAVLGHRPGPLREAVACIVSERVQVAGAGVTDSDALKGAVATIIQAQQRHEHRLTAKLPRPPHSGNRGNYGGPSRPRADDTTKEHAT